MMQLLLRLAAVLCLGIIGSSCRQQPIELTVRATAPDRQKQADAVIGAVGDIMMPLSVQQGAYGARNGHRSLLEKVAADLASADIVIGNLETPVDAARPRSGYPRFNAHPELLTALKTAGVTILSVANNHILDGGTAGLRNTLNAIEAAGLIFVGAGRTKAEAARFRVLQAGRSKVAFLAYTYDTNERLPRKGNQEPGVNVLRTGSEQELTQACNQVRDARKQADLVVLSLHWGEEYETKPSAWQKRAAAALVDAGADLIVGHHSHVLQPVETHFTPDGRRGLVAYSLGNFLSSQNALVRAATKDHPTALRGDSIVLFASINRGKGGSVIDGAQFLPTWTIRERGAKSMLYRPIALARTIEQLRSMQERSREHEQLLELLSYRYARIVDQYRQHDL